MTTEEFQKEVIKLGRLGVVLQATTIALLTDSSHETKEGANLQACRIIDELTSDMLMDKE